MVIKDVCQAMLIPLHYGQVYSHTLQNMQYYNFSSGRRLGKQRFQRAQKMVSETPLISEKSFMTVYHIFVQYISILQGFTYFMS